MLEEELGPLGALDEPFSALLVLADVGRFAGRYAWCGNGAPPHARVWLMHAFLAKSVYQFPTTAALREALASRPPLRRLCGWESAGEVPSEPTFSRAFAEFAAHALPQQIHEAMVKTHAAPKLVGHLSRDATAIAVPERPGPKPVPVPAPRRPHGRPKKGQPHPPPPPKRLDMQLTRPVAENLAELPCACAIGVKRNSHGFQSSWVGYKLHLDVGDGDVPVSALLTSASVHDNQAAIPLAQLRLRCAADPRLQPPVRPRADHRGQSARQRDRARDGAGARRALPRTQCRGTGEQPAERTLRRALGARARRRESHVPSQAWAWTRPRWLMFGLIALTAAALYARLI